MRVDARGAQMERPNGRVADNRAPVGRRWDYKSCKMDPGDDLTQYGGDGWELVSVVPNPTDPGTVTAYFKRPL